MEIIVIGGGAAGFFGAIRAAETNPSAKVLLIEAGSRPLRKVLISGGGRCNLTNACFDLREFAAHYPRGQREMLGPLHRFGPKDTMRWFKKREVAVKTEEDGRVFPRSNTSEDVVFCLRQSARSAGVKVLTNTPVQKLIPSVQGQWELISPTESFRADRLLIATGSRKEVWKMLEELGHTIVPPVPSLFTFRIHDSQLHELAGISLPRVELQLPAASGNQTTPIKDAYHSSGPLLITHRGLSGPAVLQLSARAARHLAHINYCIELQLNWLPQSDLKTSDTLLRQQTEQHGKRQLYTHIPFPLPKRVWHYLLQKTDIPQGLRYAELGKKQRARLARLLHAQSLTIEGKDTNKAEFVTAGGIELSEVDFKNFKSRLLPNLYFAGEVLNIDGLTGGFNFQAAWTGGFIAGSSMGLGV